MLFKNVNIINENFEVEENKCVGTLDDKISYIGSDMPEGDWGRVIDGTGKVLMPALYNAHTHIPMTYMRGYGSGLSLNDWLMTKIFPFEDKMNNDDAYYSTQIALAEMARFGTVSASEMYFFGEYVCKAVAESKMKLNFSRSLSSFSPDDFPQNYRIAEQNELMAHFHNAENGRIKIDYSLHSIYTNTEKFIAGFAESVDRNKYGMHIHISETEGEVANSLEQYGCSPVEFFDRYGLLYDKTLAAHSVVMSDKDLAIYKDRGVTVATCPISNLKLASGFAPVPKMLDMGIRVALGTDAVSSNNNLNMFEDMKILALIHKGYEKNPMLITPEEVLKMSTINGALAQGRGDCGAIRLGNKADVILMDISGVHMQPNYDLVNNLIYAAQGSDVVMTLSDGVVVYDNGEFPTIDIEKAKFNLNNSFNRILGEL